MKGVSHVVGILLLTLITLAIAGMTYITYTGISDVATKSDNKLPESFKVVSTSEKMIYLKNTGPEDMSVPLFFTEDGEVQATRGCEFLKPEEICGYELDLNDGVHEVTIGGESSEKAILYVGVEKPTIDVPTTTIIPLVTSPPRVITTTTVPGSVTTIVPPSATTTTTTTTTTTSPVPTGQCTSGDLDRCVGGALYRCLEQKTSLCANRNEIMAYSDNMAGCVGAASEAEIPSICGSSAHMCNLREYLDNGGKDKMAPAGYAFIIDGAYIYGTLFSSGLTQRLECSPVVLGGPKYFVKDSYECVCSGWSCWFCHWSEQIGGVSTSTIKTGYNSCDAASSGYFDVGSAGSFDSDDTGAVCCGTRLSRGFSWRNIGSC
ncbi:MAG: hypothetical protein J4431_01780 [Candidatus Aenigmarchaeota archaeon]|nr:hypothetical protein [Candidatus Aenigmarchaeota archaeon]